MFFLHVLICVIEFLFKNILEFKNSSKDFIKFRQIFRYEQNSRFNLVYLLFGDSERAERV